MSDSIGNSVKGYVFRTGLESNDIFIFFAFLARLTRKRKIQKELLIMKMIMNTMRMMMAMVIIRMMMMMMIMLVMQKKKKMMMMMKCGC